MYSGLSAEITRIELLADSNYGKSTWKLVLDDKATKKLFVARFFNFSTDS
jgi:hypothetical protein